MEINWRKLFVTIYETTSVVFLIVVASIGVIALYSRFNHTSQFKLLSVVSGSMRPTIGVGSAVLILQQADYYINDVVTYRLGSNLVTHRVVFAHNYYLTKGDANAEIDPKTVQKKDIVGKVVFTIPWAGYIQESTKNLAGLIIFILLPSFLIIAHESWIVIKEMKKISFNFPKKNQFLGVIIGFLFFFCISPSNVFAYFQLRKDAATLQITTATASPSPTASPMTTPTDLPSSTPTMSPASTPIATATPSLTPTPISSQTPQPTPSSSGNIGNNGNGSGSTNTVIINNSSSTEVNQSNTSTQINNVTNNVNTGNNSGEVINTATSSATTTINNQSGNNSVIIH